jgi:apolipoprotein N-acyltransferase
MDPAEWGRKQHLQHGEFVRLRAAENRRWMVVASSSGVTQLVDANGRVRGSLEPFSQGTLTGQLYALKTQTFFTRYGWRFPWLCIAGGLLAGAVAWRSARRASKLTTQQAS